MKRIETVQLLVLPVFGSISAAVAAQPKLVLQINADQLRGDLPQRFVDRIGDGGFRYLLNQGVVFKDAHHAHASTEAIVGHVTRATGAQNGGKCLV